MSQSLSKLYIHIIFHVRGNQTFILEEDRKRLFAYMGGCIKQLDSIPVQINGTKDHVHILCVLSKNITVAKLIQHIKAQSSKWIKGLSDYYRHFAWQKGYAAFSVSSSVHDNVVKYILNQKSHHQKQNYKDELVRFLKEYNVEYDEQYLWLDE